MKPSNKLRSRDVMYVAAACLTSICWLRPAVAEQATEVAAATESVAQANWREAMEHNVASAEGCYSASYPSLVWEAVECKVAEPHFHPVHVKPTKGNIVGNAGGSRADFNSGSSVTVKVALTDGSTVAPTCVANAGSTAETNNLTLGKCTASAGSTPSIQFTESN